MRFPNARQGRASRDDGRNSRWHRRIGLRCASEFRARSTRIERDPMGASVCFRRTLKRSVVNGLRMALGRVQALVRAHCRRMAGHSKTIPNQAVFTHRRAWSRAGAFTACSFGPFPPCSWQAGQRLLAAMHLEQFLIFCASRLAAPRGTWKSNSSFADRSPGAPSRRRAGCAAWQTGQTGRQTGQPDTRKRLTRRTASSDSPSCCRFAGWPSGCCFEWATEWNKQNR
jgi:hypothetical protein